MPKKIPLAASNRHVALYDEDWTYLESRFGPQGIQPIGVSSVIRAIIHQKVMSLRQAEIEARDEAYRSRPVGVAGGIATTPTSTSILVEEPQ